MFRFLDTRPGHYALLLLVTAALFLPRLGAPSLWDIDEGNNAQAANEMFQSGNWIVPTFNFELRTDKPALLYWLQIGGYRLFGINEFAARLPSALAAMLTVLLTYELGAAFFDRRTGLLAGIILASTLLFCGSAHFANPDALLNACTVLTFLLFWQGIRRGSPGLLALTGLSMGLGFLAKGPVALVLPMAVTFLFLLWPRQVVPIMATILHLFRSGQWRSLFGVLFQLWLSLGRRLIFWPKQVLQKLVTGLQLLRSKQWHSLFAFLYMLWLRPLRRLFTLFWSGRIYEWVKCNVGPVLVGCLLFVLVAGPWYAL